MVRLIIVRHGYSEANKVNCFCGHRDTPLNEKGRAQAIEVCEYIKNNFKVDAIYSSDLCRAFDTILPLSRALDIAIVRRRELREVDVGLWQGLSVDEAMKKFPDTYRAYKENPWRSRFEGGEGYADAAKRAMSVISEIAENHDGETVALATHGGIVRGIIAALLGLSEDEANNTVGHVANASITVAEYDNGRATIPLVGFCDYLSEKTINSWVKL